MMHGRTLNPTVVASVLVAAGLFTGLACKAGSPPQKSSHTSKPQKTASKPQKITAKPLVAPNFTLPDADGKSRTLAEFRGRPVTLFFYCGCEWCHKVSTLWGQFERGGALPKGAPGKPPATLIVYAGDAAGVKQFANETGISGSETVLLTDPQLDVTISKFDAEPCPRVFVIDPAGKIVYTNNHKDDAARQASEMVIASRALDALRKCTPSATSAQSAPASRQIAIVPATLHTGL